jgi:CHAT domain-containing protein
VGDVEGEADTLNDISEVYQLLGEYQLSLDSYNQTLSLYRKTGNITGEAKTLDTMGQVYRSLEEYQKALDSSTQALAMWRKQSDRPRQIATLTTIVRTYESLGDYQQALDAANQIMVLGNESSDRFSQATGFIFLGRVYRGLGEYQKALDSFNQGLSLMQAMKFRQAEPPILDNIGKVYDQLDQPQKAIEAYNQALSLWRGIGDRTGEAESLYSIAGVERKRGNLDAAKKQIESVINIVESLRSKVVSQELRTSYFASVQKYYQFYIGLLMQLHKTTPSKGYDALALQASERARARSLLEILTEANADIRRGVDPQLLEQERSLQQQLNATQKRQVQLLSGNYTEVQADELEKEIATLLTQYQAVETEIRQNSPRYAALTQPQPLTLEQIQQQVLDDDTLLLEYSLGEERSYLWAVTKTGITSYELPKRADIEAAAQDFYKVSGKQKFPERRGSGSAPRANSIEVTTKLSQMLLSPVAGQLGQKRLLIVSDGALQYVPFAALPAPDTVGSDNQPVPLIVKHEIVNLPSASTLAVLRQDLKGRKPAAKTIAVLADPVFSQDDERVKPSVGANGGSAEKQTDRSANPNDLNTLTLTRAAREAEVTFNRLPFTRKEADRILALVPPTEQMQVFDFAASRAIATSPQLSQYRIVHFATHGILNSKNPELSGVVLSLVDDKGTVENGFLRLHDIFNLNLPAELVVLSACKTGLGQEVKGEGLVGLTRGFMYAGAPRVLVSLWNVDDEGTSELMSRFYKKMLQEGQKPSAALRAAQIEMLQETKWKSPYYWAAFVLQGEWK